ncbi:MAG TPA: enoyl-CoA hydratase-related protein [Vicinamibacteria bacterium]|nr:enoyl-CoA hydratase-related protein [Vicinamibacteria bacterium]
MTWDHIRLEVHDAIATVTLDRPEALNAFTGSMRSDLLAAIQEGSERARALIVTGAGTAFSAGGDVKVMANARPEDVEPLVEQGKRVVTLLQSLPIPTLAAVNGVAVGAGLGLALACDVRMAARTARLGASFARVGLHPDWGVSYFLTRIAGPAVARDLVFSGRLVPAEEALSLGIVNWVVPADELLARALQKAREFRDASPVSIRWAKQTLARAENATLEEVLELEQLAQLASFRSEDAREGLNALVEKRTPNFKGR